VMAPLASTALPRCQKLPAPLQKGQRVDMREVHHGSPSTDEYWHIGATICVGERGRAMIGETGCSWGISGREGKRMRAI